MAVSKYVAWALVILPTMAFGIVIYTAPEMIIGKQAIDLSIFLSLLGVALGYFSLIFSAYAAVGVQGIADLYFFKIRSPEILKKLRKISREVSDFGSEPSTELNAQRFMPEALVAMRSAKRMSNKHVKRVAKEAEVSLKNLKAIMKVECTTEFSAGQITNYWDFYQKISELVDEIVTQIEEAKALP